MFEEMRMLYLYVESPLHVGTGRGLGGVDLPIQRERTTGYPMVHASSLKGCLRQATANCDDHAAIFGPETANASDYAGAVSPHDARILLLPVRSLKGVFAWTTSIDALQRFMRSAEHMAVKPNWSPPAAPASDTALVAPETDIVQQSSVVLEDFCFSAGKDAIVNTIGEWIATEMLPADGDQGPYKYWRDKLPKQLCILPDDQFTALCQLAVEVATRVQIDNDTKTVKSGALWTEEYLPVDSLLYAPIYATKARNDSNKDAKQIMQTLVDKTPTPIQLGGNETIGRGMVAVRYSQGGAQ